jgi:dTMP kinase
MLGCKQSRFKREIMKSDAKFIVFEGLDGAGKSTLISGLESILNSNNEKVVLTREPGGTILGDSIRELLLKSSEHAPVPRAELLLYEASRAQHVDKVIRPALSRGEWVISDRFSASTVAFQVGGRNLELNSIEWLNRYATDNCEPDLWVLLDISAEEAQKRMQGRNLDRFESEKKDFHERVRSAYLDCSKRDQHKWLVLDASKSKEELMEQLLVHLQKLNWI